MYATFVDENHFTEVRENAFEGLKVKFQQLELLHQHYERELGADRVMQIREDVTVKLAELQPGINPWWYSSSFPYNVDVTTSSKQMAGLNGVGRNSEPVAPGTSAGLGEGGGFASGVSFTPSNNTHPNNDDPATSDDDLMTSLKDFLLSAGPVALSALAELEEVGLESTISLNPDHDKFTNSFYFKIDDQVTTSSAPMTNSNDLNMNTEPVAPGTTSAPLVMGVGGFEPQIDFDPWNNTYPNNEEATTNSASKTSLCYLRMMNTAEGAVGLAGLEVLESTNSANPSNKSYFHPNNDESTTSSAPMTNSNDLNMNTEPVATGTTSTPLVVGVGSHDGAHSNTIINQTTPNVTNNQTHADTSNNNESASSYFDEGTDNDLSASRNPVELLETRPKDHHRIADVLDESGIITYNCVCQYSCSRLVNLETHMKQEVFEKAFKCPVQNCDNAYSEFRQFKRHCKKVHQLTNNNKGGCFMCGTQFKKVKHAESHKENCNGMALLDAAMRIAD